MGKQEYPTGCREELEDARGSNSGQRALDGRVKACGRGRRSVRVGLFLTVLFITVACLWGSKEPEPNFIVQHSAGQPAQDKKRLHTSLAQRSCCMSTSLRELPYSWIINAGSQAAHWSEALCLCSRVSGHEFCGQEISACRRMSSR